MNSQTHSIAIDSEDNSAIERRTEQDRRHHNWHTLTYCGLQGRGRRRQARRDGHNYYLDWYKPGLVFTGLAVLLLSCLDALLTLTLLNRGAYEANLLMAHLLETSDVVFVVTKVAVTAIGIVFLLMHSHFRLLHITSGKRILQYLVPVYGLLIIYELFLLGVVK
ncbi:MAG: hypothetical protein BMS9Abin06_1230 [Gammaproteobacteria bacterium]|nr:MAG: hypothetical protein BMS9Abin06_1230 [Gammaproteobacteria bacterium]